MKKDKMNLFYSFILTFIVMVGTKLMGEGDKSYVLLIPLFMIYLNQLSIIKKLNIE